MEPCRALPLLKERRKTRGRLQQVLPHPLGTGRFDNRKRLEQQPPRAIPRSTSDRHFCNVEKGYGNGTAISPLALQRKILFVKRLRHIEIAL